MEISDKRKERLAKLYPFMDDFSRVLFRNKEVTEYFLSIILGKKLNVKENIPQKTFTSLGREIILDVYAEDENGEIYNIELQTSNEGASGRRVRLHHSFLTLNQNIGKYGELLKETYVIIYSKNDIFKKGYR